MSTAVQPPVSPEKSVPEGVEFDQFARNYDAALQQGLSVSGESKEFFAAGRVNFLKQCLTKLNFTPRTALDYGCGTGTSVPLLHAIEGVQQVLGVDLSAESIEVARKLWPHEQRNFVALTDYSPTGNTDLVFCNGVFHHIPLDQRDAAVKTVFDSLRPGGMFAYWENNPWNPATRYVMSRIPFDKDAITLTPPESRGLLQRGGFEVLRTDFLFIFPKMLSWFRPVEKLVSTWPIGTQYQVLCRKP
jgi:SAM-dependent methyltransferase